MAQSATLYRVRMELSDVERSVYKTLEFRVAQHPSEGEERLLARVLAYGLFYEEGLEFGKGISDADEPALLLRDLTGQLLHWIDVGAPSADRIHLATKKSPRVTIIAHKGEDALSREMVKRKLHRAEEVCVYLFADNFIRDVTTAMTRNSDWTLVRTEGELSLTIDEQSFATDIRKIALPQPSEHRKSRGG